MQDYRVADRRVQKTRALLHGALASLVHEKAYDDIVVKEILDRANVGRSTFYAHYRDKDELLEGGIHDLLGAGAPASLPRAASAVDRLLRFSLPFLAHVERSRDASELPLHPEWSAIVHEHLRRVLESRLAGELRTEQNRRASRACELPAELLARHVASTFVLSLGWWMEHHALGARDVDDYFRALVAPALRAALGD